MLDPHLSNPAVVDPSLDSRAATFENPTGERGAGGSTHGGRKGAPNRRIGSGEMVVLADITGPGVVRHIWMTLPPALPEQMRAVTLEVFYDGDCPLCMREIRRRVCPTTEPQRRGLTGAALAALYVRDEGRDA